MHIDYTFTVGNLVTIAAVVGAIIRIEVIFERTTGVIRKFMMEHEMLVREYCKRNNIDIDDLPTRFGRE